MNRIITFLAAAACAAAIVGCSRATAADSASAEPEAYLFAYFTGNNVEEEQICYAVSRDGYEWTALNGGKPVIASADISRTGGVRDPHLLRGEDGKTFYMVATDMTSSLGWSSNRGLTMLKSPDLINWTASTIHFPERFAGQDSLLRVWAPQTIYDPEAGRYMVYFSTKYGPGPDIIQYAYANDDFTDLDSLPRNLFVPADSMSCIDGDIVVKDGLYHLFYKTEGHGNGIRKAVTPSLTSGRWTESPDYKQQTDAAVEGAGIFKLNGEGEDRYILMYDVYMSGRCYDFTESTDLERFTNVTRTINMDFHPRHGSVLPITAAEYEALTTHFNPND